MKYVTILLLALAFNAQAETHDLPDAVVTPGVANPLVTQDNIQDTICVPGFSKTQRPPASYTTKLKIKQLRSGVYKSNFGSSSFEEDHLISIENGGDPRDPKNLWPQHWNDPNGAKKKDILENVIHKLICDGTITLEEGQLALAQDWIASYQKYVVNRH